MQPELNDIIKEKAKELLPRVIQYRRHLHQHPELSFSEHKTAAYVQQCLSSIGIDSTILAKTGVVALIQGQDAGRVIALRADMDALPIQETNECAYKSEVDGVMHACGHDVHTASLLGVAEILHATRNHWSGTVKLIFQPGEEQLPGGASEMIKAGVLEHPKPELILAQHVFPELESGRVGFRAGSYMASADEIYMTVVGKGGHAALPQNNVDPIVISAQIILALQQIVSRNAHPVTPTVLSFGKIVGLGATNIIPSEVKLEGTFRTFDETWRFKAHDLIRETAEGIAKSMGGRCVVEIAVGYPFLKNDEPLTRRAKDAATDYLGANAVVDLDLRMTAEDFAFYAKEIPACFYRLGTRADANGPIRALHSSTFDVDESALETAIGLMTCLAINELTK